MTNWLRTLGRIMPIAILAAFAGAFGETTQAAPPSQSAPLACSWNGLPVQARQGLYFSASAYDSNNNKAYFYGGVNQIGEIANNLIAVDLANTDLSKATLREPQVSGARSQRYAAAGAYRPAGADSALYFIGGASDDGEAQSDIQTLDIDDGLWRKVVTTGGKKRMFHAATYVPNHDVIVTVGGTRNCAVDAADRMPDDCEADNIGTQFLTFDAMTGDVVWVNGPNGGPQNFMGLSLVYDSRGNQVLAFGGSRDNNLAENRVWSLDVSDPDLSKASWRGVNTSGTTPKARYHHAAAYDSQRNMMVVHGGVAQSAFVSGENVLDDSWGLDLSGPQSTWMNLDADFRDLVGHEMVYASRARVPVLLGGRARFKDRGDSQTTFRDPRALECGLAPTPTPEPTRPSTNPGQPKVCAYLARRVPAAVINDAIANANSVRGFGEPLNPSLPPGPSNPLKTYLGLQNEAVPYHPLFNSVVYKAGCP